MPKTFPLQIQCVQRRQTTCRQPILSQTPPTPFLQTHGQPLQTDIRILHMIHTPLIRLLHDIRRDAHLARLQDRDLALDVELRVCTMRRHAAVMAVAADALHVRDEAGDFVDFDVLLAEEVGEDFLDERFESGDAGADEADVCFDAGPDGGFEDVVC
jgi:hypothetical protein